MIVAWSHCLSTSYYPNQLNQNAFLDFGAVDRLHRLLVLHQTEQMEARHWNFVQKEFPLQELEHELEDGGGGGWDACYWQCSLRFDHRRKWCLTTGPGALRANNSSNPPIHAFPSAQSRIHTATTKCQHKEHC